MKPISRLFPLLCLAALSAPALAQPNTAETPKTQNPENRAPGANRPNRPNREELTPEQRQQFLAQMQKRQLERLGVQNAEHQTLIVNFITKETEAQTALREKSRELERALRGTTTTDTQVLGLLADYNAAVEENATRRDQAIAALKKAVDLSKSPRLEALLTVQGLIGDGPQSGGFGGGGLLGGGGLFGGNRNRENRERGGANANRPNGNNANGNNANGNNANGNNAAGAQDRREERQNRERPAQPEAPAPQV